MMIHGLDVEYFNTKGHYHYGKRRKSLGLCPLFSRQKFMSSRGILEIEGIQWGSVGKAI